MPRIPRKPDAPPPQRLLADYFERGQGYANDRPQGIYDWLLICTTQGSGLVQHTDGDLVVKRNDLLLIEPNAPHAYRTHPNATRWHLLWAHFEPTPAWRSWLNWPEVTDGVHLLPLDDRQTAAAVRNALKRTHELFTENRVHSLSLALNALEEAILWADQVNPRRTEAGGDPRLQQVIDFVNRQMHEPIGLPELADAAGLSESRLSHLFRERLDITPQRYLEQQRLSRAQQLLEATQQTIGEVAEAVGYRNPFYFSNRFTRAFGVSPSAYRKGVRQLRKD